MIDHEVIVIGAGVAGIYQIKRLVDLGAKRPCWRPRPTGRDVVLDPLSRKAATRASSSHRLALSAASNVQRHGLGAA
jgi:hypothetical protein